MWRKLIFQTGVELELVDSMPLLEWLANNYKSFGATLEIITDRSQEGSQYVRGFGGIGGMYWTIEHYLSWSYILFFVWTLMLDSDAVDLDWEKKEI